MRNIWTLLLCLCLLQARPEGARISGSASIWKLHVHKLASPRESIDFGVRILLDFKGEEALFLHRRGEDGSSSNKNHDVPFECADYESVRKVMSSQIQISNSLLGLEMFAAPATTFTFANGDGGFEAVLVEMTQPLGVWLSIAFGLESYDSGRLVIDIALRSEDNHTFAKRLLDTADSWIARLHPCTDSGPCLHIPRLETIHLVRPQDSTLTHHVYQGGRDKAKVRRNVDAAIESGWRLRETLSGRRKNARSHHSSSSREEEEEAWLELLETDMATGVATGFMLHSINEDYHNEYSGVAPDQYEPVSFLQTGVIPFITAGVVPIVSEQVSNKMIAVMDYYVAAALSDGIGGSPPNTDSSGKGLGVKSYGDWWKETALLETGSDPAGGTDKTGMSKKAKFPGLMGKTAIDDLNEYVPQLVQKMYKPVANLITFSLNATVPYVIRHRVVRDVTEAAAAGLFDILTNSIWYGVTNMLAEKVPIYLAQALNTTLTDSLTRSVTQAVSAAVSASLSSGYNEDQVNRLAEYFADYYSPSQMDSKTSSQTNS
mmetsp:Transcript_8290/g.15374  ORF Transcript_8290/g.15374 Transcript_8290/m.15374 type:complete len:545 (+) Transcript_8290:134-1768(+)